MKDKQWFINRIGKRIYRHTDTNCCEHCQKAYKDGIVVNDENHAYYLHICQLGMGLVYSNEPKKKGDV